LSAAVSATLTNGYRLRRFRERDAEELHALIERNRGRLARWIHWAQGQTAAETLAFLGRARAMEQDGSGFSRGIVDADDRLAGVVGITVDRSNRAGTIGYWLDAGSVGKGLVAAAVAALAEHGFEHYRLLRIEIRADVENRASCAVAERLGFQREGVARQAYRVNDEYQSDDAVYSLLASDPARRKLHKWLVADAAGTSRD
jgi:ribosomal-protein-serine acetyltransferase